MPGLHIFADSTRDIIITNKQLSVDTIIMSRGTTEKRAKNRLRERTTVQALCPMGTKREK